MKIKKKLHPLKFVKLIHLDLKKKFQDREAEINIRNSISSRSQLIMIMAETIEMIEIEIETEIGIEIEEIVIGKTTMIINLGMIISPKSNHTEKQKCVHNSNEYISL